MLEKTTPTRLAEWAKREPDRVALRVTNGPALTYSEWEGRSNALANGLIERGVGPGDRVLLLCGSDCWIDYAVAYVGVHKAAATAVPVLHKMGEKHRDTVIGLVRPVAVVSAAQCPRGLSVWTETVTVLEKDQSRGAATRRVDPNDPAEILFTSGTTGRPKGVVATHANVLFTHADHTVARAQEVVLHALPPGTTVGQGLLLQPLDMRPFTVLAEPAFRAEAFLGQVERYRPRQVVLVPALATALASCDHTPYDLTSVSTVRLTSAPSSWSTLEAVDRMFPHAALVNMYASTESWPARTRMIFDRHFPGSVGRPAGNSAVRIVDADGRSVAPGALGEIQLRAAGAPTRHYFADRDATAGVFLEDGWVRTGDLGRQDEDGYLYVVDRREDIINNGGMNISTLEIEEELLALDGISEAAVVGISHPALGEFVAAAVVVSDNKTDQAIQRLAEERLGSTKAPKRVVIVENLPRNALGKVIKPAVRTAIETVLSARQGASVSTDTETEMEREIAGIWAQLLGVASVGPSEAFLELGGTSLSAMDMVVAAREKFGRSVRVSQVLGARSLREFAKTLQGAPQAQADGDEDIPRAVRS